MQQLEIVYSGIKGAILVTDSLGPPTVGGGTFIYSKNLTKKAKFIFPLLSLKCYFYIAIIIIFN